MCAAAAGDDARRSSRPRSMSKPILCARSHAARPGRPPGPRPAAGLPLRALTTCPTSRDHRRITARMALTHRTGFANWRAGYDDGRSIARCSQRRARNTRTRAKGCCSCNGPWRRSPASQLDRAGAELTVRAAGPSPARVSVWTDVLEKDLGEWPSRRRQLQGSDALPQAQCRVLALHDAE